jgi:hypothetical protein
MKITLKHVVRMKGKVIYPNSFICVSKGCVCRDVSVKVVCAVIFL